jgi:hypothetical protein
MQDRWRKKNSHNLIEFPGFSRIIAARFRGGRIAIASA